MSRYFLMIPFVSLTMIACGAKSSDNSSDNQQQALSEAKASAESAKACSEACFKEFETCIATTGADVVACKTKLSACVPDEASPGPHCGAPDAEKGEKKEGEGTEASPSAEGEKKEGDGQPVKADAGEDEGIDKDKSAGGGEGTGTSAGDEKNKDKSAGDEKGGEKRPDYCDQVPLPQPDDIGACRDALKGCIEPAAIDKQACFEVHLKCVAGAFESAKSKEGQASGGKGKGGT